MNADRLHAIAIALKEELRATDEVAQVKQLATAMRASVNEPTQPNHGVQVANFRESLERILANAPSNRFSAAWRQTMEELDVASLFGDRLLARIEEIFTRNEITPASAANDLEQLSASIDALDERLDSLLHALGYFDIGTEDLKHGEFEIGFLIPREAVDNELGHLGEELVELKKLLLPFQELATGTRDQTELQVRTISSSGFQVFLQALPDLAVLVSQILESLLSCYETVRRIRGHYADLAGDDVPNDALSGLLTFAGGKMELDIQALTEKIIDGWGDRLQGEGRANEITVEVKRSITATATRIDEGYVIEVREYRLPPVEDGADAEALPDGATPDTEDARRIVAERQPRLQALNLTGNPILGELTAGDDDSEEAVDDGGGDEGA